MKKYLILFLFPIICYGQLTNGTIRKSVMTDQNGSVISSPLSFSNQVAMLVTATSQYQVVNFSQFTNSIFTATNAVGSTSSLTNVNSNIPWITITNAVRVSNLSTNSTPIPIANGGIGTNSTVLIGSWTNTVNHRVNGTNDANAYMVKGILGFNGSITNLGPGTGSSNVMVYTTGILTNKFTIP